MAMIVKPLNCKWWLQQCQLLRIEITPFARRQAQIVEFKIADL
jgi:hypothetical protein